MASSPEQEIPQEVVKSAYSAWYTSEQKEGATVWNSMRAALAAVLPDLQRPLLKEIERERETRTALARIADSRKTERDAYVKVLGEVNVERQRQEVRAIEAERERDARPDLTAEEIHALLNGWRASSNLPFCPDPRCDAKGCIEARRIRDEIERKLERSLDAHKP